MTRAGIHNELGTVTEMRTRPMQDRLVCHRRRASGLRAFNLAIGPRSGWQPVTARIGWLRWARSSSSPICNSADGLSEAERSGRGASASDGRNPSTSPIDSGREAFACRRVRPTQRRYQMRSASPSFRARAILTAVLAGRRGFQRVVGV